MLEDCGSAGHPVKGNADICQVENYVILDRTRGKPYNLR